MGHAAQSSTFRERLLATIGRLAVGAERHEVAILPETISTGIASNRRKLMICACDLSEEEREQILCMLNHPWTEPLENGRLQHWCKPGCCSSRKEMRRKLEHALFLSLGRVFEPPLLYRWKHWEGAIHYALRNTAMHNILAHVWQGCMNAKFDEALVDQLLDPDSPDLDPGAKQQVRLTRVLRMLSDPSILAKFAQCVVLTAPLAWYMDRASLVETVRHRVYLRVRGLDPPSTCPHGEDDLRTLNLDLLTGVSGLDVVRQYYTLLTSEPGSAAWHPDFDLPYQDCVLLIFSTVCDTWRRLVLPYQSFTYTCLRVASMSTQEGLEFLWREYQKLDVCNLCRDQQFAQVPCLL